MTVDWVMYAGMAAWIGIGLYIFFLARKQAGISLRIRRMELADQDGSSKDTAI